MVRFLSRLCQSGHSLSSLTKTTRYAPRSSHLHLYSTPPPQEFDDGKGTERDSVTKLHQDMSDAVNILNFVQVNAEERDLYGLPKQSPEEVAMAAVDARRAQAGAGGTSRAGTTGAGGGDGRSKAAESQAAVFAAAYNEVEAAWREKMPPVRCGNQLPAADDPGWVRVGAVSEFLNWTRICVPR